MVKHAGGLNSAAGTRAAPAQCGPVELGQVVEQCFHEVVKHAGGLNSAAGTRAAPAQRGTIELGQANCKYSQDFDRTAVHEHPQQIYIYIYICD